MPLFRFSLRLWWVITKRGTPPSRRNAAESVFSEDGNGGTARSTVHSFTPHWRNGAGPKTRGGLEPRPICHRRRRARGRAFPPNRAPIARSVSLRSVRPRRRRGRTWRRSARRISSSGSRTRTRTSRCYRTSSCTTRRSPRPHPPPRTPPRARRAESSAIGAPPRAPPEARPPRAILLFGNSPSDFGAASCTPTAARRRWRTVPSARRRARRRRRSSLRRRPGRRAARAEARREKPTPRLRESVFFGSRRTWRRFARLSRARTACATARSRTAATRTRDSCARRGRRCSGGARTNAATCTWVSGETASRTASASAAFSRRAAPTKVFGGRARTTARGSTRTGRARRSRARGRTTGGTAPACSETPRGQIRARRRTSAGSRRRLTTPPATTQARTTPPPPTPVGAPPGRRRCARCARRFATGTTRGGDRSRKRSCVKRVRRRSTGTTCLGLRRACRSCWWTGGKRLPTPPRSSRRSGNGGAWRRPSGGTRTSGWGNPSRRARATRSWLR